MGNLYYLHFRDKVSPQILDALSDEGASIKPVFETSFYVMTDLSLGQVKRIFKTSPFVTQCNVVKVKGEAQFLTADD